MRDHIAHFRDQSINVAPDCIDFSTVLLFASEILLAIDLFAQSVIRYQNKSVNQSGQSDTLVLDDRIRIHYRLSSFPSIRCVSSTQFAIYIAHCPYLTWRRILFLGFARLSLDWSKTSFTVVGDRNEHRHFPLRVQIAFMLLTLDASRVNGQDS
jgi:hypothetical protein